MLLIVFDFAVHPTREQRAEAWRGQGVFSGAAVLGREEAVEGRVGPVGQEQASAGLYRTPHMDMRGQYWASHREFTGQVYVNGEYRASPRGRTGRYCST
eukprot:388079-Rhodomonas_salina.2